MLKDEKSIIDTKFNIKEDLSYEEENQTTEDSDVIVDNTSVQIRNEILMEIQSEREFIINEAKAEAERITLDAKKIGYKEGFAKGKEKGHTLGFEEGKLKGLEDGYAEGIEQAKAEADEIKKNAMNMLSLAEEEVAKYMAEKQQEIISLAAQMAESIIHHKIDTSSDNILQLIKPIIQQSRKAKNIIITCNSDSYDYLRKSMYEIERKYPDIKFIVLEDENLEKNGCIVENENQIIDLQIREQLNNIIKKINNME